MVASTKTELEHSGDLVLMRFEGDITSASEEAVLGKYKTLTSDTKRILLDFSKVPYINSSGIALVIQTLMAASKVPQKVACFGLSPHFMKVFTMVGLGKYTTLHADEAGARAAVV